LIDRQKAEWYFENKKRIREAVCNGVGHGFLTDKWKKSFMKNSNI